MPSPANDAAVSVSKNTHPLLPCHIDDAHRHAQAMLKEAPTPDARAKRVPHRQAQSLASCCQGCFFCKCTAI